MADTEPIRVGIAGLGRAGWGMHCNELKGREDRFRIVAGSDPIRERRDWLAGRYNCAVYRRTEELIADPNVELVSVATRSTDHVRHTVMALQAGKSVFVEKPIAVSYSEALRLKSAAAKSKGKLYVRHNRRFEPAYQHIREIMASRILGDVFEIKLRRLGYSRRDDWQALIGCGGGQLLNWGPHIVDHGLRMLESPLRSMWSDLKKVAAAGDAEDHLKIILKGNNGRIVDLEISGGAALSEPEWTVLGSKGALTASDNEIRLRYLDPAKKLKPRRAKAGTPPVNTFGSPDDLSWVDQTVKVAPKTGCDMTSIWDALYRSMREGKSFPITLDEALEVMRVISAARKGTPFAEKI